MFDPHHNAVDKYYLVNGSLEGFMGGTRSRRDHRQLERRQGGGEPEFFADRGHTQIIAGYYDGDDLTNFQRWDAAARQVEGVVGFMYTTWQAKYGLLEAYARAIGADRKP